MDEYSPPEPDFVWLKYGLQGTPYSTLPMRLIGSMPIERVFSGRKKEVIQLKKLIRSSNSSRNLVVGNFGVGKTTFANFVRWELCRKKQDNNYLTTNAEIKIQEGWDSHTFLHATLAAIYNSSIVFSWEKKGLKIKTLGKIKDQVEWLKNVSIQGGVAGISGSYSESKSPPPKISNETLEQALSDFCKELSELNKELIIQYDNLENIELEKLANLFKNIREYLQIEGLHTVFLGPPQIISALEKFGQVHSTFSKPIFLDPLTSDAVIQILEKRCEFLQIQNGEYIKPYEEKTVKKLYEQLMNIRFTFKILEDTTMLTEKNAPCKITMNDIEIVQNREKKEILSKLTDSQVKVISALLDRNRITISQLSERTKITPTNLSPIIKNLRRRGLIVEEKDLKDKRIKYIKITDSSYLHLSFTAKGESEKQNKLEAYGN